MECAFCRPNALSTGVGTASIAGAGFDFGPFFFHRRRLFAGATGRGPIITRYLTRILPFDIVERHR